MFDIKRKWILKAMFMALLTGIAGQTSALPNPEPDPLEICKSIISRVDRLKCFDTQLLTPESVIIQKGLLFPPDDTKTYDSNPEWSEQERIAREIENERGFFSKNWTFRYKNHGDNMLLQVNDYEELLDKQAGIQAILMKRASREIEQSGETMVDFEVLAEEVALLDRLDVYLTTTEIAPSDAGARHERAVLVLRCLDNVSTLSIVLPTSTQNGRWTNVFIRGSSDDLSGEIWHVDDTRRVISAPRGHGSIRRILWMIENQRVQFEIRLEDRLRAFIFDTFDLSNAVVPLRTSCEW